METRLASVEAIAVRLALEDLNNDFCYFLDHGLVDELVDLFCEDAIYTHGERQSCGQNEIRQLFAGRKGAKGRTSRHILSGLRLEITGDFHARGKSVCLTFAENSSPPVTPATPYLVADFDDEYRLCSDGRWRIEKRHIERIFIACENKGPEGLQKK